jgi:hypothetical protein
MLNNFFQDIDPEMQLYIHRLSQIPWLTTTACCQGKKPQYYSFRHDDGGYCYSYIRLKVSITLDDLDHRLLQPFYERLKEEDVIYMVNLNKNRNTGDWILQVDCESWNRDKVWTVFCECAEAGQC